VGATGVDVVDDEVVLLDVVVALVVEVVVGAAVVEVDVELEEELAPEVVLVLEEAELPVVEAIEVVVSATVDDDGAAVVSVVDDSAWDGSVTAADFGDSDCALALESPSAAVIPPRPVGRPSRLWPSIRPETLASDPLAWAWPASPRATDGVGSLLMAWIARGAPTASAVTVDNVRASRKRGRTGASRR